MEEGWEKAKEPRQIPNSNSNPNPKKANGGAKPYDMSERLLLFADRVLYIAEDLPSARGVGKVREQIVSAGTSIGANYEEADGAETRADKKKSLVTSRKEARESRWWLRLIYLHWKQHLDVKADIAEATELILILSRMIQLMQP
ncbi:MAG: hypothetical protein FD180_4396 [Planctomycetota bacterium]|nr:MAG: hypothetical protein FD180_4396 [Planctomycetota bacterium]